MINDTRNLESVDIVIVGAGGVGLTLALLLSYEGIKVHVIGNHDLIQAVPRNDGRILAISYFSVDIFKKIGIWDDINSTNINSVHVSSSKWGAKKISGSDIDLEYLGSTIEYADVYSKLANATNNCENIIYHNGRCEEILSVEPSVVKYVNNLTGHQEQIHANLVIVSDVNINLKIPGITTNINDYKQYAITSIVKPRNIHDHHGASYERVLDNKTYVLLPYKNRQYVLTYAVNKDELDDNPTQHAMFTLQQDQYLNRRFGAMDIVGDVSCFPLKLQVRHKMDGNNIILLGNAKHTLHPVLAQGLNLALREVATLVETICKNGYDDVRIKFEDAIKFDVMFTTYLTNIIAQGYLKNLRSIMVFLVGRCATLRHKIARLLIFGK